MVNQLRSGLLIGAALLFCGCAVSSAPSNLQLARGLQVATLEITENGAASPDVDPADCLAFELDATQVRSVLEVSDAVTRDQYLNHLPWSPCLVRGRLEVRGGGQGTWTIRQYGSGSVLFDDGAERFFWCKSCTWPPFVAVD